MKKRPFLLAVAITIAAAACSGEIIAPDPALQPGEAAPAHQEIITSTSSDSTDVAGEDGGYLGSGVGQ